MAPWARSSARRKGPPPHLGPGHPPSASPSSSASSSFPSPPAPTHAFGFGRGTGAYHREFFFRYELKGIHGANI